MARCNTCGETILAGWCRSCFEKQIAVLEAKLGDERDDANLAWEQTTREQLEVDGLKARVRELEDRAFRAADNVRALQDLLHKASCEIDRLKEHVADLTDLVRTSE